MENNKITLIPSVLEDVFKLKDSLRLDDINELEAIGSSPLKGLLRGFIYSDECFTVLENNEKVIGMFGVNSWGLPKGFASIWYLGSDECKNHPMTFVREGIRYSKEALTKYDILVNCVDARNTDHLKWLKTIGMNFSSSIEVNGHEFIQFYKVRS